MSMTSTAAEDSRRDDFTYESIKVECKLTRTLVASVNPGDSWESHPEMYSRDRTSTKNILSTTRKFTSDFPTTVESDLTAGESFPIDITGVEGEVSLSTAVTLAEGFEESTRIENSLETDTETTFREPVEKTFEGLDNVEKVIYEEKSFYDDLEVTSNLLTTFKEGWDGMKREETFTVEVYVGVGYKWFHVETPGGYRLSIADSDVSKSKGKSLLVQEKTEEDGQLWRWHGKHLCNKLGEVMAIDQDGTAKRGANVVTLTKRPEMGQKWEVNGKHILSEIEGLYLAVRRGGKGSKVCVWTKTDEEDQHWSIFSEDSTEGDFRVQWWPRTILKPISWLSNPTTFIIDVGTAIINPPKIDDVIDAVVDDFTDIIKVGAGMLGQENIENAINLFGRSILTDSAFKSLADSHKDLILRQGKIGLEVLARVVKHSFLPDMTLVNLISKMVPAVGSMFKHVFDNKIKSLLGVFARVAFLFEEVRKALMEFDFEGALKAFLESLKKAHQSLLDKIKELPFGSLQVFVIFEAAGVAGCALEVGFSLNIRGLLHYLANFGSLEGWPGDSFISVHVGVTVSAGASAGADAAIAFGYHFSTPDGVDGVGIGASIEFTATVGGGLAVACPIPFDTPNQIVISVGGGAQIELALGVNYTYILTDAIAPPTLRRLTN